MKSILTKICYVLLTMLVALSMLKIFNVFDFNFEEEIPTDIPTDVPTDEPVENELNLNYENYIF